MKEFIRAKSKEESESLSWKIFDNWRYIRIPRRARYSWRCFNLLQRLLRKAAHVDYEEYESLSSYWNKLLKPYGGDPNRYQWQTFRPLRLSREEDWSDWLSFIIERSASGYFFSALLGLIEKVKKRHLIAKQAIREDVKGSYRADIIVTWKDDSYSHIEVKTGDMNFVKTFGTSRALQEKYGVSKWSNYILLLPGQADEWEKIKAEEQGKYAGLKIESILWSHISIALRKSILFSNESLMWKAWSYAYLGTIEQKLLGIPEHARIRTSRSLSYINSIRIGIDILKEGRKDGKRKKKRE